MGSVNQNGKKLKKSFLDITYHKYIDKIINTSEIDETRLDVYNVIVEDLIEQGRYDLVDEFKYRFTDGENPNEILLNIIEREDTIDGLLWHLNRRLEEFLDEDLYKRFL